MVRDDSPVTLEEVIGRLDEFSGQHAIYAEAPKPGARALVASDDGETDLSYLLEVALAREAVDVWRQWRPGRSPTLADEVAAVIHYAVYDAWLPME